MTYADWDYDLSVADIDLSAHTGLLLAEDAALMAYLRGITVPDKGSMIPVGVWFRWPEGDTRIKYPFITIDFLAINPSYDRWTSDYVLEDDYAIKLSPQGDEVGRGMYIPSTSPDLPELDEPEDYGRHIDPYLMYKLMYQITVHSRSALHDRYLASRFATDILPPRPFFIGVDADATWRRCESLGMQTADTSEVTESGNKRIFRKVYTITMDAEIPQSKISEVALVKRVHADVYSDRSPSQKESVSHEYDDVHTYAESVTVEPPPGS